MRSIALTCKYMILILFLSISLSGAVAAGRVTSKGARVVVKSATSSPKLTWDQVSSFATACINQFNQQSTKASSLSADEYAKERRAFIVPLLKALNAYSENRVPNEPIFPMPTEPKARRQAKVLLNLDNLRFVILQYIGSSYLTPPYATEELRELATSNIHDATIVKKVMDEVSPYTPASVDIPSPQSWDGAMANFMMYRDKGYAGASLARDLGPDDYSKARRDFIVPLLKALKVLKDNNVPTERIMLPTICMPDTMSAGRPGWDAIVKEHNAQMEARRQAGVLDELVSSRFGLMVNIIGYYAKSPSAMKELREIATTVLKDDALVKEIIPDSLVQEPVRLYLR